MEDAILLQACRTPLPSGDDRIALDTDDGDSESDVEDWIVYDVVSQVCDVCDQVLTSPSRGPLCKRCHAFMYPEYTLIQQEFDDIRTTTAGKERKIPYHWHDRRREPHFRPRHRCGKDGFFKHRHEAESNAGECANMTRVRPLPALFCFSETESEEECEGEEVLGLARLAIYDKDLLRYEEMCSREEERTTIRDDLVETFPTEILVHIFSYLDEVGLYKASQVCQRWHMLTDGMENWSVLFEKKWPLFRPVGVVTSWRDLYIKMVEASTCVPCFQEGFIRRVKADDVPNTWRNKRLRSELKLLLVDPPEGIRACPVDDEYSNWQASIAGPPDSVYENGIFYLHLELPRAYPMSPPRVRFLSRILHPNVNRHGDIGIDCLRNNWSLALTIPKVLVSIQSLLTDPYCHVCMDHVVGRMYVEDRGYFNIAARDWTRKFAQHHYQNPELKPLTIW